MSQLLLLTVIVERNLFIFVNMDVDGMLNGNTYLSFKLHIYNNFKCLNNLLTPLESFSLANTRR